jgi:hypothetical protein
MGEVTEALAYSCCANDLPLVRPEWPMLLSVNVLRGLSVADSVDISKLYVFERAMTFITPWLGGCSDSELNEVFTITAGWRY